MYRSRPILLLLERVKGKVDTSLRNPADPNLIVVHQLPGILLLLQVERMSDYQVPQAQGVGLKEFCPAAT